MQISGPPDVYLDVNFPAQFPDARKSKHALSLLLVTWQLMDSGGFCGSSQLDVTGTQSAWPSGRPSLLQK